jgi:hypothetical protein
VTSGKGKQEVEWNTFSPLRAPMHKLVQVTGLSHMFDQDMFAAPQALYSLSSRPTT